MRKISIIFSLVLLSNLLFGQYKRFLTSGYVEYEKSINMYAMIKKKMAISHYPLASQALDRYKENEPQFKKVYSKLTFWDNKTLYTPISAAVPINEGSLNNDPITHQLNIIYTDLTGTSSVTQKTVFDETFLLKDSVRKIHWKITDETRDILGYACRRANGIMLDSIYIVAFYTNEIPMPGGPESFNGLPGLILGVALPHENVTWFATRIVDAPTTINSLTVPNKGKLTDFKGLVSTLRQLMKSWNSYAQASLKAYLL